MNPAAEKREQGLGWILAAAMLVHVLVLRPQSMVALTAFAALLAGALLRGRHVYAPRWLGNILLLLGIVAVVMAQVGFNPHILLGEMAVTLGTLLLLQPVTPRRAQRIVFCMLIILVAAMFKPGSSIGTAFTIFDVAVLYLLIEQAYQPPEVAVSFLVSVVRSFRVIVPVGIVVLGAFWLFPNFSLFNPQTLTGFSGGDFLNPGTLAELSLSQRVALTAHFTEDQAIPLPSSIYWRGQVLENNEGFRWTVVNSTERRAKILKAPLPNDNRNILRYTQDLAANSGGIVPVLDHGIFVEAKRDGQDVVVNDRGAGVLGAVGAGALTLDVTSSTDRLMDEPKPNIAGGYLNVPKEIRNSAVLQGLVNAVFADEQDTPGKLRALTHYFQKSGFRYSVRPGHIPTVEKFLTAQRIGFCEHYATAAANLLRLAGVPTRVVAGFRGGEWNPWLRTITVRDSDAHAWVEAWDAPTHRWLRFDPTDAVAPELRVGIQSELDSSRWPWYRRNWSYSRAVVTRAISKVDESWTAITSSESWEYVPKALFMSLVVVALIWLVRNLRARRASSSAHETAARLLADLERRAAGSHRERHRGETPLAWLHRLELDARETSERETLRLVADSYESGMYRPGAPGADLISALRQQVKRLIKIWRNSNPRTRNGPSPAEAF
ncbi:hypothetical protein BH10PSE11_BH10PSE11_27630 [soil metagenome]